MEALLNHPRTHRMPNMSIIGETNNGKTMLLRNFANRHNPPDDPNAEKTRLPVLLITTPPAPDESRLYYEILDRLCAAGSTREPERSQLRRIRIICSHLEVKMLLLDDFYNSAAGTPRRCQQFLNALRNLSNVLEAPIVVSGTPATLNELSTDSSIANQFKPVFLPKWDNTRLKEFARFVKSVEPQLYLHKPCELMDRAALTALLTFSEGLLGEVVDILRLLAEEAIQSGTETIDSSMINKETLSDLGWVIPSDRSRYLVE